MSVAQNKIILMCKDVKVAETSDWHWNIFREELLPRNLVVKARKNASGLLDLPYDEASQVRDQFIGWCAGRVLSIDRHYAKKVLNVLCLSQSQTPEAKAKIATSFRCVSLVDSYWIRFSNEDKTKWHDISLRHNSLSKVVALIALSGSSMTLSTHNIGRTAEISTLGSYAKGWFRHDDGVPYLYKTYGPEKDEVEREVCASNVIDCFNIYGNLKYEIAQIEGVQCSRCKVLSTDDKAIVHAADMDVWCARHNTNVMAWTKKNFLKEFAQMMVIDYLLANSDRHMWNWGFYQDMNTGEIIGLHDLYDHNNCFDSDLLKDEYWKSIVEQDKTMKEAALYYVKRSDLRLLRRPTEKIFPNKKAFSVFVERCRQLGLWAENQKPLSLFESHIFSDK